MDTAHRCSVSCALTDHHDSAIPSSADIIHFDLGRVGHTFFWLKVACPAAEDTVFHLALMSERFC